MSTWTRIVWVAGVVGLLAAMPLWALTWQQDLDQAQATAHEKGLDLLIYFAGPAECEACAELEQKVFQTDAFAQAVGPQYVPVRIEAVNPAEDTQGVVPIIKRFEERYGLKGAPTVFLAGSDGRPYGRLDVLPSGVEQYLQWMAEERRYRPLEDVGSTWLEDLEMAKAKARVQGKDVLVLFTGSDWCPGCIMMEGQVFSKPEFQQAIAKEFVLFKADSLRRSPQPEELVQRNQALMAEYQRKWGYDGLIPTLYLVQPDGTPYSYTTGRAMAPKDFADMLIQGRRQHQQALEKKGPPAS